MATSSVKNADSNSRLNTSAWGSKLKIAYHVWEYYPRLVGGLGTYAIEITRRFVINGDEVFVFALNPRNLATRELWKGVMVHRPKIINTSPTLLTFVTEDLELGRQLKLGSVIMRSSLTVQEDR